MADNDSHQPTDDGGPPSDAHGDSNNGGGGDHHNGDQNGDSGTGEEVKLYVGNLDYGEYTVLQ